MFKIVSLWPRQEENGIYESNNCLTAYLDFHSMQFKA